ncbi:MAG: dTDP-4-amino-4,6-dideoxygalactose transaminase [Chloroflexaceae bacterium]
MSRMFPIPFNRPCFIGNEQVYIVQSIANGHISGDGPFTRKCEAFLAEALRAKRVLLTTSCTHALEIAGILLQLAPGDEVIVPSFTFVSTANAFALQRARPVFADIRPDTLNIDERAIESLISPRTRAIVPVHYAGVGCDMDTILEIAKRNDLVVIEDNAHGLFGRYKGQFLGTFGRLATQSFHETKNFSCGEGGALIINDLEFLERAEIVREKGTNRSRFFRGQIDKYTWVDFGSSYVMSDILAAYLFAQLEAHQLIQARRQRIWNYYYEGLREWAHNQGVRLPFVPQFCDQSYHMFYLLFPSERDRDEMINYLKSHGILSVFHYQPLHLSPMGQRFGGKPGDCPVTEQVSRTLLRLPLYNDLSETVQEYVVEIVSKFNTGS